MMGRWDGDGAVMDFPVPVPPIPHLPTVNQTVDTILTCIRVKKKRGGGEAADHNRRKRFFASNIRLDSFHLEAVNQLTFRVLPVAIKNP